MDSATSGNGLRGGFLKLSAGDGDWAAVVEEEEGGVAIQQ